jgi:hypothetical protein
MGGHEAGHLVSRPGDAPGAGETADVTQVGLEAGLRADRSRLGDPQAVFAKH